MLTEKTNKILYSVLIPVGMILMFGGFILDLFPDSIVPQNDWFTVCMMYGISFVIIGDYLMSLKSEDDENGGCSWFCLGIMAFFWSDRIKHFTAPIIAGVVLGCILLIIALILNGKRWRRAKAKEKEQEESENDA